MIKNGLNRIQKDRRDYDFLKSHKFGVVAPVFPESLNSDAQLTMPDQNAEGYPMGCTGYTQSELCIDEDKIIYDPAYTYKNTPPYDNGGRDIRESLKCIINLGPRTKDDIPGKKRTAYFNIRSGGGIDWFDAVRIALLASQNEGRTVSVGTPWYQIFELPSQGILNAPTSFSTTKVPWHNWKIVGWKLINGKPYLIGKSWQGINYGDNGFHYVSRDLFNKLMKISGTGAFTTSKVSPLDIQTVDLTWIQSAISYLLTLLQKISTQTPPVELHIEKLHIAALMSIGTDASPADKAPDEFGCAESVSNLIKQVYPNFGQVLLSTKVLADILDKEIANFKRTLIPEPGCIIVSPRTDTVSGHCGIFTTGQNIISNNSKTGLMQKNYTLTSWAKEMRDHRGLRILIWKPLG